jgi:hypothetical protein
MKVDKNALTFKLSGDGNGNCGTESNIPIRLELASRIMAGMFANDLTVNHQRVMAESALIYADALIEAHNKTVEGE